MATSPKYSDPEILARIGDLTLRARQVAEGTISGLHRSPFHGFNVEFAEYREYSPGDDLRGWIGASSAGPIAITSSNTKKRATCGRTWWSIAAPRCATVRGR